MNKRTFFCLLAVLCVVPFVYADVPSNQKIQTDTDQLKKDYQQKIGHDLKRIEHKIQRIKHEADTKVNSDLSREAKDLETQKKAADKKLAELGASTGDAWKDLQKGMDKAVSDLKKSVDQAAHQFKATPVPKE